MSKLDPFPPPSERVCEEFGRTAYYAQRFERELKLFLLAGDASGRVKLDLKKSKSVEDHLDQKTLGWLQTELESLEAKHGHRVDSDFHDMLREAVGSRNLLMHRVLQNVDPLRLSSVDEEQLLRQLGEICLVVGNAFLVMREFRKALEKELGFTEEQLQEFLDHSESETDS